MQQVDILFQQHYYFFMTNYLQNLSIIFEKKMTK